MQKANQQFGSLGSILVPMRILILLGEHVASFAGNNLDQSKKASDFNGSYVYSVSVWEVETGKDMQLIQAFMESKTILEETGARVEIYQGNWR